MTIFEKFSTAARTWLTFFNFSYMISIVDKLSGMVNPFIVNLLKFTFLMKNFKLAVIYKLGFELNLTLFFIKIHI